MINWELELRVVFVLRQAQDEWRGLGNFGVLEVVMAEFDAGRWGHYTARVNGINVHYVLEGDGEPVVFLHGWPEF